MKYLNLSIIFLIISFYSSGQINVKTPTGVDIYNEVDNTIMDAEELAACWAHYDSLINVNGWNADIKANGSYKYNCHGYAWHISDGGDTVKIPNVYDVEKYFSGDSAAYEEVDHMNFYSKIYYNGAGHSARADTVDLSYVWSKWGPAVLVRHAPDDCPYENYTKEYYDLIIDNSPNSVAKGCAADISTLNINNATYNWSSINSYACVAGSTFIGEVTGLNTTPGVAKGKVKVEITSPYSHTTVKGIKEFTVTSQPSNPFISGPTTVVCSNGASFTLNNVPAGNIVTWSSSSNLSTSDENANPCTFVSTGNGNGWITASVSTGCAQNMFTIDQFDVWRGVPVFSYISGPTSTPNYEWATYYVEPYNALMELQNNDYTWTLNPLNGNSLYNYGRSLDIAFYNSGSYQLVVRAENECGPGPYTGTYIDVYDSKSLSISPNPSSGEVEITIESTDEKELFVGVEWELEVYDNVQNLKEKKEKLKDNSTKIQTSEWKEGVYLVRVKYKDDILTDKLEVKK